MDSFSFLDLVKAYKDCRKRKRTTNNAIEFEFYLEDNLIQLYEDLKSGNYEIGQSICFVITRPKPREVWAACFRDRIVHHLVYNKIKERFFKRFISDTYSCIPKRGTMYAAYKLKRYIQSATNNYSRTAYYLKADIRNFFVSIDKNILFQLLKKQVFEPWVLELLKQIIFHNPKNNVYLRSTQKKFSKLPSNKSLWNTPSDKGLPIGNLTSQFFSNVYLDVLDKFIKHTLKCKYYCRYVDDFVIVSDSPQLLNFYHREITKFLQKELLLSLHQNKKLINKTFRGVDFVGYTIKPNRMYLRQMTIKNIFSMINFTKNKFNKDTILSLVRSLNSYLGFLRQVNAFMLRKQLCSLAISFCLSCDSDFTKIF